MKASEALATALKGRPTLSNSVLVTYATRYGATQEVTEAVAASLRERGLEIDIQPVREVRTLEGYRAVVLGAPIFYGHWHKDARRFLSRHRETLTERPVAVFALGPLSTDDKEMQGARAALDKALVIFPWLAPVALEVFVGKYDPTKLRFPDSLVAAFPASPLKKMPASDLRDWATIRAWASNLAAKLQPAWSGVSESAGVK